MGVCRFGDRGGGFVGLVKGGRGFWMWGFEIGAGGLGEYGCGFMRWKRLGCRGF